MSESEGSAAGVGFDSRFAEAFLTAVRPADLFFALVLRALLFVDLAVLFFAGEDAGAAGNGISVSAAETGGVAAEPAELVC